MFKRIQRDVAARIAVTWISDGERVISEHPIGALRIIKGIISDERLWPIVAYRYKKTPIVGLFFRISRIMMRIIMGVKIDGDIGSGFSIGHASSIFINKNVVIGRDARINQGVTIAGRKGGYPVIGDNVHVSAGAVILGPIRIGDDVHIGANAVVLHDVPDNSTVVGIPARIVRLDGRKVSIELPEYWKATENKI